VGQRVQELVRMPCRREWTGLRLSVSDHACNHQRRIVEYGPERMTQGVSQLAALMNRSRAFRGCVTWDSAGERELCEQLLESRFVPTDARINLAVRALQVRVSHDRRAAVARTADID